MSKEKPKSPWYIAWPLTAAITAPLVALGLVISGHVVSLLWGWFFVPLGLPVITWLHGAGIDLLVTFVASPGLKPPTASEGEQLKYWAINFFVRPAAALLTGWVVHLVMV